MDRQMYDSQTDRHTDVQRETVVPCHYRVAVVLGIGEENHNQLSGKKNQLIFDYTIRYPITGVK